ncbi:winged helix-turn-helix domain-containing protein [Kribbella kalugense]|uniref:Helix-turn-helix protein n=1 Tax=Kribbella kalugense TaxID=2512221 RepID=A0A4R8A7H0_9ACTN|nr:helix-turn-helix domain-containing protein [Kribbella kalugense]TDW24280.1 helix-turn-helix protein [Kribbella kalugense]
MDRQTMQQRTVIDLGNVGELSVSVSLSPYVSVLAVLADVIGGRRQGLPEPWRRAVRHAVAPANYAAMAPIVRPGESVSPDFIVPLEPVGDVPVRDQVEQLRESSFESLLTDLDSEYGRRVPPQWQAVARAPRTWGNNLAGAVSDAWAELDPAWRGAQRLLEREVNRVGTAVVRGGLDGLLTTIHPRITYEPGRLTMADPDPARYDLAGRRLVLVPMIAGRNAMITRFTSGPEAQWVAYPVPGIDTLWNGRGTVGTESDGDVLSLIVGQRRASILRALRTPMTMQQLARVLECSQSTITYHCDQLHIADLIRRERHAQQMWGTRTERGDRIVELLSGRGS